MVIPVKTISEFNAGFAHAKDKLVVIYFYTLNDNNNQRIEAVLEQLAEKYGSKLLVLTVDFATEYKLFDLMRHSNAPTFAFYKNFEHVAHFTGADIKKLEQTITEHIN